MTKTKRCIVCKKRQITNMKCPKCHETICINHRYSEDHNCSYNFKIEGKKQLEIENQKIISEKINII